MHIFWVNLLHLVINWSRSIFLNTPGMSVPLQEYKLPTHTKLDTSMKLVENGIWLLSHVQSMHGYNRNMFVCVCCIGDENIATGQYCIVSSLSLVTKACVYAKWIIIITNKGLSLAKGEGHRTYATFVRRWSRGKAGLKKSSTGKLASVFVFK